MSDVTRLIEAAQAGDRRAAAELLPLVYEELRKLAAARMAAEAPGHTLSATALVHEAYLRLVGPADEARWVGRGHFFAAAAEAMRRILIDSARRKALLPRIGLDVVDFGTVGDERWLELNDALDRLAQEQPLAAEIVKLRLFAGVSVDDAAASIGLSRAQGYREWSYARAWLSAELRENSEKSETNRRRRSHEG